MWWKRWQEEEEVSPSVIGSSSVVSLCSPGLVTNDVATFGRGNIGSFSLVLGYLVHQKSSFTTFTRTVVSNRTRKQII